jgi:nucleotide-binding universal stress UspA family protein
MMFNRILVPLDGSETAEGVLPFVIAEAKLHGATVVLLRVVAPLRQSLMVSPRAIEDAYKQIGKLAKDYLELAAEKISSEGIKVKCQVEHGRPAKQIIEIAQSEDFDLVMIGSHGETGSREWRFGGVANKVVKADTSIPIMIIPT